MSQCKNVVTPLLMSLCSLVTSHQNNLWKHEFIPQGHACVHKHVTKHCSHSRYFSHFMDEDISQHQHFCPSDLVARCRWAFQSHNWSIMANPLIHNDITGPLWRESTNHWWIPLTKGQSCGALMMSSFSCCTSCWTKSQITDDLRCHYFYHLLIYWLIYFLFIFIGVHSQIFINPWLYCLIQYTKKRPLKFKLYLRNTTSTEPVGLS